MLKNFLMRKFMESQLKGVPDAEREKFITLIEKNPDFFTKLATEIKAEMDAGKDQQAAALAVLSRHGDELKKLLG